MQASVENCSFLKNFIYASVSISNKSTYGKIEETGLSDTWNIEGET